MEIIGATWTRSEGNRYSDTRYGNSPGMNHLHSRKLVCHLFVTQREINDDIIHVGEKLYKRKDSPHTYIQTERILPSPAHLPTGWNVNLSPIGYDEHQPCK